MLDIINFINKKIGDLHSEKGGEELKLKLDLLKKLAVYINNHDVSGKLDEVVRLGDMNTGYSEYRVINDCESDDSKLWIEYMNNNENVRLSPGDLLIKMK